MGWELELTDAVYNNDIESVRNFLQQKDIRRSLGEQSCRANRTACYCSQKAI